MIPSKNDDSSRYFFVHIMKTAGFSLLDMMTQQVFGKDRVYPNNQDADRMTAYTSYSAILHLSEERKRRTRLFSGHLPFCARDAFGSDVKTIVFLRDPVSRTVSKLRHIREFGPVYATSSLSTIYEDPGAYYSYIDNHQLRVFAVDRLREGGSLFERFDVGPAEYDRAIERLHQADFIGLTEDFTDSLRMLESFTGWKFSEQRRINETRKYFVPPSLVDRIREDSQLERRFYEYARGVYLERKARWLSSTGSQARPVRAPELREGHATKPPQGRAPRAESNPVRRAAPSAPRNAQAPKLSIVVTFSNAARQVDAALFSLSCATQMNVGTDDYEILAVETRSDDLYGADRARAHGENVHHHLLESTSTWRTEALRYALSRCRAPFVGVLLDGAYIATPRVVEHALAAARLGTRPLVVVPEYFLGEVHSAPERDMEAEGSWLALLPWKRSPYALLPVSRFGATMPNGYLNPLFGATLLFAPRTSYEVAKLPDARADLPGAAALKCGLYTNLARLPRTRLFVLAGEGVFRQLHPELLDPAVLKAERKVTSYWASAVLPLGADFTACHREPMVFGVVPGQGQPSLRLAVSLAAHVGARLDPNTSRWYEDRSSGDAAPGAP